MQLIDVAHLPSYIHNSLSANLFFLKTHPHTGELILQLWMPKDSSSWLFNHSNEVLMAYIDMVLTVKSMRLNYNIDWLMSRRINKSFNEIVNSLNTPSQSISCPQMNAAQHVCNGKWLSQNERGSWSEVEKRCITISRSPSRIWDILSQPARLQFADETKRSYTSARPSRHEIWFKNNFNILIAFIVLFVATNAVPSSKKSCLAHKTEFY